MACCRYSSRRVEWVHSTAVYRIMLRLLRVCFLASVALGLPTAGFGQAQAQVPPSPSPSPTPTTRATERDGRVILSDQQINDLGIRNEQKLPLEIKERLRKFEAIREAYLREQAALRKRLAG